MNETEEVTAWVCEDGDVTSSKGTAANWERHGWEVREVSKASYDAYQAMMGILGKKIFDGKIR